MNLRRILSSFRARAAETSLSGGTIVLASGTAFSQLLLMLISPVLTRLYSPQDFGVLAAFSAVLSIVAVVSNLRYERAIPVPKEDSVAASLVVLAQGIGIAFALSTLLLTWLFRDIIATYFELPPLRNLLWLLPLGVLGLGISQPLNFWAVRKKAFSHIATTKLQQSLAASLSQIGLGLVAPGAFGLIVGYLLGAITGASHLGRLFFTKLILSSVSLNSIVAAMRHYAAFPKFSSWSGLIGMAGIQAPIIALASFFGPETTGWYALGQRVVRTPAITLGTAITQVYFSSAPEAYLTGRLASQTTKVLGQLVRLALPPVVLIAVAGPDLFSYVFGAEWSIAGVYLRWLTPLLLVQLVSAPIAAVVAVLGLQKLELKFSGLILLARPLALVAGLVINPQSAITAIAADSILSALLTTVYTAMVLRSLKVQFAPIGMKFLRGTVSAFLIGAPLVIGQILRYSMDIDIMFFAGLLISLVLMGVDVLRQVKGIRRT